MNETDKQDSRLCGIDPESYFPFVYSIAGRFCNRYVQKDELFQSGVVGLLEAVKRFDPARGVPFAAFAFPHIEGAVRQAMRTCFPIVCSKAGGAFGFNPCLDTDRSADQILQRSDLADNEDALLNRIDVRQSITSLSKEEREIIKLRYFRELTQIRTAESMNISQSAVSKQERNALLKLKKHLMNDLQNE